jgi:hypothetical protein
MLDSSTHDHACELMLQYVVVPNHSFIQFFIDDLLFPWGKEGLLHCFSILDLEKVHSTRE